MKRVVLLLGIVIPLFCCCCSSDGITKYLREALTVNEPITSDMFFSAMFREGTETPSGIKNFQGIRTQDLLFINYYLRYHADKKFVLDLVASMPASASPEIDSDEVCRSGSGYGFSGIGDDLSDVEFWMPSQVEDGEYYECIKFPWVHSILFDKDSDTIYHVVYEIH